MVYHLQVISAKMNKNNHSRQINIEIDNDYPNFEDIENQIDQKFHKKISDLSKINNNEYFYNHTEGKERIEDYVIRINERN